jgi:hypothetical protein
MSPEEASDMALPQTTSDMALPLARLREAQDLGPIDADRLLEEALASARSYLEKADGWLRDDYGPAYCDIADEYRASELWLILHAWLTQGGPLPRAWQSAPDALKLLDMTRRVLQQTQTWCDQHQIELPPSLAVGIRRVIGEPIPSEPPTP